MQVIDGRSDVDGSLCACLTVRSPWLATTTTLALEETLQHT